MLLHHLRESCSILWLSIIVHLPHNDRRQIRQHDCGWSGFECTTGRECSEVDGRYPEKRQRIIHWTGALWIAASYMLMYEDSDSRNRANVSSTAIAVIDSYIVCRGGGNGTG